MAQRHIARCRVNSRHVHECRRPNYFGDGRDGLAGCAESSAYPHDVGNSCTIDLAVNQHQTYDLQLLLSENYWDDSERGGNIALDNTLLVENLAYNGNAGPPFVYHYTFTASSSMVQLKMIGISGFNSTPTRGTNPFDDPRAIHGSLIGRRPAESAGLRLGKPEEPGDSRFGDSGIPIRRWSARIKTTQCVGERKSKILNRHIPTVPRRSA